MTRLLDVTTRWHLLFDIEEQGTPRARAAFGELIGVYWLPVFEFFQRWLDHEDACDLTQDFFTRLLGKKDLQHFVEKYKAQCLLEKNNPSSAQENNKTPRPRGWFRFWLRLAAWHHLVRHWKRTRAKKRGGRIPHISEDHLDTETKCRTERKHNVTADRLLERRRAYELIERVIESLRNDKPYRKQPEFFEALMKFITDDTYELQQETAKRFGKTPEAMRKAIFDFKERYQKHLDNEVAKLAHGPQDIEEKKRDLVQAIVSADDDQAENDPLLYAPAADTETLDKTPGGAQPSTTVKGQRRPVKPIHDTPATSAPGMPSIEVPVPVKAVEET